VAPAIGDADDRNSVWFCCELRGCPAALVPPLLQPEQLLQPLLSRLVLQTLHQLRYCSVNSLNKDTRLMPSWLTHSPGRPSGRTCRCPSLPCLPPPSLHPFQVLSHHEARLELLSHSLSQQELHRATPAPAIPCHPLLGTQPVAGW